MAKSRPMAVAPHKWPARSTRRPWRVGGLSVFVALSVVCLFFLVVAAAGAEWLMPYDYQAIDLRSRLSPPVWADGGSLGHIFGTDELGRDVLSRLIFSVRISLFVALVGTLICAVLGTALGFIAAHFRGWVDDVVMAGINFQAALPFMILVLAVITFFSNSFVMFIALMGIYGWERYARITRGMTLSAVTHGYAVAVYTLGARPLRIYGRHILPNIANALIVNMTLNFPQIVLLETSLSFLGLGIQPPLTSLGNMVGFGRDYLLTAWWIAVFPSSTIFVATLAMSIIGDWVRDRIDPTLK